jgi:hypothetical protein
MEVLNKLDNARQLHDVYWVLSELLFPEPTALTLDSKEN